MPKIKTRRCAAKRFSTTGSGKFKRRRKGSQQVPPQESIPRHQVPLPATRPRGGREATVIHRVTAAGALKRALFVLLFAAAAGAATPPEPASQVAYEHNTRHDTPADPLWKGDAGPVVLRWLSALFDPDAAKKDMVGAGDRAYLAQIEEQARAQIEAAEEAFAAVYLTPPDWCTRREDR